MGGSNASLVVRVVLALGFFFDGALVSRSIGCPIMLGSIGAVTDVGMHWGNVLLAGEAVTVAVLSSAFLGDFLFSWSLRSSLPPLFVAGPDSTP